MRRIVITLALLLFSLPAAAAAQELPTGNSGIDQYQESIPGVGGNRPTSPGPSGGSNTSGTDGAPPAESRVSPRTAESLERLGPDGKATAAAAEASAPGTSQASGGGSSGDSDPGMGWVLPLILALALAGALAAVLMRRRGGTPPGPA